MLVLKLDNMSHQKVLIDFDEYMRLKDIESAFETEKQNKSAGTSNQHGAGSTYTFHDIRQIADLVRKELSDPTPVTTSWQNHNGAVAVTTEIQDNIVPGGSQYDITHTKTEPFDKFDAKKLLMRVPKEYRKQAENLFEKILERSSELSFDSSGTVFINEEAIPQSNIFKYFPFLFKKRTPKHLPGFEDFITKLKQMDLAHFIHYSTDHRKAKHIEEAIGGSMGSNSNSNSNWWYIG